jgi:hypothetical protein
MMYRRLARHGIGLVFLGILLLAPAAATAQVVVKVNDTVNFRFGLQIQAWADWLQDPNSEGYSQNLFLRRIRAQILATVAPGVMVFYQTDNPRDGNAGTDGNKIINTGFLTQDALAIWKICGDPIMLEAGLYLVPTSRNGLTSTASFLSYDIGTWALQGNTVMKGNGGRDFGVGLHGWLVDDHLEYRIGAFEGNRNPTSPQPAPLGPEAGSRNSYRVAGRIMWDFLDTEKQPFSYTYAGTNRGTKKILAIGAWGDGQDSYKAYGGDFIVDLPVVAKDAVTFEFDYNHFEGGSNFPSLGQGAILGSKQNDIFADAGWYFDAIKLQPYVVFQELNFTDEVNKPKNQKRYGGGLNWYIYGQNLKISVLYERIVPKTQPATAVTKDTNHFSVQLQALYF